MDTNRQERMRYVILLCVCLLVLVVTTNPEEELKEGLNRASPAGQGTKHTNTVHNDHDGSEKQRESVEEKVSEVDGNVKTSQDVDPPPGDTQEDSAPDSTQEDTPKLKAPLPPVGDTHTPPPTQQGDAQVKDLPVVQSQRQPDEGVEKLSQPDTPSGQEKLSKETPSRGLPAAPKLGSDSTEPETPKARDGPTGSDTQQALPDTQPDTASDLTSPEKDNAPGKVEVIEKPKDEGVLEGELKEEDVQEKVASDELKVERMVEEEGKGGEDKQEELAAELLEARKREQDLPSFDEWKLKIIAEQAEQAKQAKQEKMEAQASQQVNKKKVNYASMTCGAKLVVANPEAKNAASILNENKDQYMIQPCQAKKWFVVELCEPVAIQSLEIANLELFSSLPESFIVYTSERYPTKEWQNLGTFRARDERAVQSFPIIEEEMFSKYVKVEPLTHYGDEHYCPLTLVRVYGTTVVEDYEDSDHMDHSTEEEDSTLSEPASQDEPANLFTSATENSSGSIPSWIDTVISLVKTVLSPGEKEKEEKIDDIVKMNATSRNKSLPNISHAGPSEGEQTAPCTPGVSSGEGPSARSAGPAVTHLPVTPGATDSSPIVTLIESPSNSVKVSSLINQCNFCQDLNQPTCYSDRSHICGYYRVTNFVLGTSCPSKIGPKSKEEMENLLKHGQHLAPKAKPASQGTRSDSSQEIKGKAEALKEDTKDAKKDTGLKDSETTGTDLPRRVPPSDKDISSPVLEPSVQGTVPTQTARGQAGTIESPSLEASISVPMQGTDATGHTAPLTKTEIPLTPSCDPSQTDCNTMGPDIVQIRPTTTEEALKTEANLEKTLKHEETGPVVDNKMTTEHPEPTNIAHNQPPPGSGPENNTAGSNGGMEKVIYADSPGSHDGEYELEMLPPPEEGEAVHKLSSGRRENAFMKLKNRIKALELNLTLSSRYLEELSKRYRREMEDMYLSLNKTILKLTNTSRTAEQRDVRQQANITDLTKRIKHLTEQVDTLKESLVNIHTQVIERHLFLMMVEFVLFLLIITWLLNRVQQPQVARAQSGTVTPSPQATSTSAAKQVAPIHQTKPPDKKKKSVHKVHQRRNSIDATPPRPKLTVVVAKPRSKDDMHLRLSGSESRFGSDVLDAAAVASSSSEFKEIVPKRKKKKKNKGMVGSQSTSNLVSSSSCSAPQSSTSASRIHHKDKVGLIFSSKSSKRRDMSPANSSCSSEGNESPATVPGVPPPCPLGGKGKKQQTARRSLDLKDLHKQNSDPGLFQKHRRLASDGVTNNGTSPVTDIGPFYRHSKSTNGNTPNSENPPSAAYSSSSWKSWLLGTRN